MASNIKTLLDKLGIEAADTKLYEQAFTHMSFYPDKDLSLNYDRLETLGDAVLSLVVLDISYKYRPEFAPKDLTLMKIDFVQANSLIEYGKRLGFGEYIRVGKSIRLDQKSKIYEDVFEAFIGAIYLDSGFEEAYKFIEELMGKDIRNFQPATSAKNRDYKSELQIAFQADSKYAVIYKQIDKEGADNDPIFTMGVYYQDVLLGIGRGKNKKLAEQEAASVALRKMVK